MSALDSLVGLLELRKADSLVLVAGKPPALLGGKEGALTMPPLDAATVNGFLEELLSPEQRQSVAAGQGVELAHTSARAGTFVVRATLDAGRTKLVIRRGVLRNAPRNDPPPAAVAPPPVVATPAVPTGHPEAERIDRVSWVSELLARAWEQRAADLVLSSGRPPVLRLRGELVTEAGPALEEPQILAAFDGLLGDDRRRRFAESGSVDLAIELPGEQDDRPLRFRANLFRRHGGVTAVLRPIWDRIPTLESLNLPRSLRRLVDMPNGLVLVAGPTGSGKSTTLAALLELVNQSRACHVLTLEDPIEYVFPPGRAIVHQREVGTHMRSFADGLRNALRESPDVILVGEMRDPDTILAALTAAETGHLVLSTIHAGSAAGAIERVLGALPEVERSATRAQLASTLRHVVVQHLLPSTSGARIPAVGVLAVNHAVASLIREGRTQLLATQMEVGAEDGMVTLEAALAELVKAGKITRETAFSATSQRDWLEAVLADRAPRTPVSPRP